jgi:hypothetical protein
LRQKLVRRRSLRQALEPGGIALIATDDYLDSRLAAAVRDALLGTRWVLPAKLAGAALWLGPLIDRDGAERFAVLLRRLGDNRPADLAALSHGARFPLIPPQGLPETFDLAAAWIVAALEAIGTGSAPPALVEGVLTLDPWTLETCRHPITICRANAAYKLSDLANEHLPIELAANPKRYTGDGGHRVCPPHRSRSPATAHFEFLTKPLISNSNNQSRGGGQLILRLLHACSGCFRLERLPGGVCTHWKAPPCHGAHPKRSLLSRPYRTFPHAR